MNVRYRWGAVFLIALSACGDEFVEPPLVSDAGVVADGPSVLPSALLPACETKRLKLIVASPGDLRLGHVTSVEAQLTSGRGEGSSLVSWWLYRESVGSPQGAIESSSMCRPNADACARFVCTAIGSREANKLWIMAKYEDATCFDVVRVDVACEPDSGRGADAGRDDAGGSGSQTDSGLDSERDVSTN